MLRRRPSTLSRFVPLPYPAGVDVRLRPLGAPLRLAPDAAAPAPAGGRAGRARPSRGRTAARPSSPSPAAPGGPSPASARGGRCGRGTRPGSRASGCRACSPPPGGGPCRRTRRASGSGTGGRGPARPASAWATLSRRDLRLAQRRAGRSAATACPSPPGPGPPRRRRSPTRRGGRHRAVPVGGDAAAAVEREPELRDDRVRLDARGPDDGAASGRPRRWRASTDGRGDPLHRRVRADLDPAPAQLGARRTRRAWAGSPASPGRAPRRGRSAVPASGSAGSGRRRRRRSPAARRAPRGPRSRRRRTRT